jgi:hypothetical protein
MLPNLQNAIHRRKIDMPFMWLCAIILAFCYELPLIQLTAYDRLNPRLFDVVSILGLPLLFSRNRAFQGKSDVRSLWFKIVAAYVFCGIIWAVIVPRADIAVFCLYYTARYIQCAVVIRCAQAVMIDDARKKTLARMMMIGGLFVALYTVPEYISGASGGHQVRIVQVTAEKTRKVDTGALFGPLSNTYFHIGVFSTLSLAIALAAASQIRVPYQRWFALAGAFFIGWPTVFCGSRAALVGAVVVVVGIAWTSKAFRRELIVGSLLAASVFFLAKSRSGGGGDQLLSKSFSFSRLFELEQSTRGNTEDTLEHRLFIGFAWSEYFYPELVPFIGAGFYVAPVVSDYNAAGAFVGDHGETYRIGYGIHNMYLFPLEQGGLAVMVLFFFYLRAVARGLKRASDVREAGTKTLAIGVRAFFYAMLVMGIGGQVFWYFDSSGNLLTYLTLTFILATTVPGGTPFKRRSDRDVLVPHQVPQLIEEPVVPSGVATA